MLNREVPSCSVNIDNSNTNTTLSSDIACLEGLFYFHYSTNMMCVRFSLPQYTSGKCEVLQKVEEEQSLFPDLPYCKHK